MFLGDKSELIKDKHDHNIQENKNKKTYVFKQNYQVSINSKFNDFVLIGENL